MAHSQLVVRKKHELLMAFPNLVADASVRVTDGDRLEGEVPYAEAVQGKICKGDPFFNVPVGDWKGGWGEECVQGLFDVLPAKWEAGNGDVACVIKKGSEGGEAHDVVPVHMGEEEVA